MPDVGLEQTVMEDQVDIRDAVLRFRERLTDGFGLTRLILFGSRARGDYHAESDADVAVILSGKPGDFLETKLAMADRAFDVLLETGVLIQAFPIWESQWQHPEQYSHPAILGGNCQGWTGYLVGAALTRSVFVEEAVQLLQHRPSLDL